MILLNYTIHYKNEYSLRIQRLRKQLVLINSINKYLVRTSISLLDQWVQWHFFFRAKNRLWYRFILSVWTKTRITWLSILIPTNKMAILDLLYLPSIWEGWVQSPTYKSILWWMVICILHWEDLTNSIGKQYLRYHFLRWYVLGLLCDTYWWCTSRQIQHNWLYWILSIYSSKTTIPHIYRALSIPLINLNAAAHEQIEMTARQKREANLGYVLVSISALFIICQLFKIIPDIYEVIYCRLGNISDGMREDRTCGSNNHIDKLIDVSHLFLALNSSVNVVIYAWRGTFTFWSLPYTFIV